MFQTAYNLLKLSVAIQ